MHFIVEYYILTCIVFKSWSYIFFLYINVYLYLFWSCGNEPNFPRGLIKY